MIFAFLCPLTSDDSKALKSLISESGIMKKKFREISPIKKRLLNVKHQPYKNILFK
jgi:hypothetical protein